MSDPLNSRFIVEFTSIPDSNLRGRLLPSLNRMDAPNLQLAIRDIERSLAAGVADEAIIYIPVRVVRAERKVDVFEINRSVF